MREYLPKHIYENSLTYKRILVKEVCKERRLRCSEQPIYEELMFMSDAKTGICYAAIGTIQERLKEKGIVISRRTIIDALERLAYKGAITKQRRSQKTSLYVITDYRFKLESCCAETAHDLNISYSSSKRNYKDYDEYISLLDNKKKKKPRPQLQETLTPEEWEKIKDKMQQEQFRKRARYDEQITRKKYIERKNQKVESALSISRLLEPYADQLKQEIKPIDLQALNSCDSPSLIAEKLLEHKNHCMKAMREFLQ